MSTIKSVVVKGYQALHDVTLGLCPGVNVIVGESDSGKSSFVRALRDALYQARGAAFVSDGAKKASVKIEFADGRKVEWHKGKNVNYYKLDGERLGKPGSSVPEPVQAATGFRPIEFGEGVSRRVNFACQGEPMFLVADPPGEAARIIGGVSGAAELAGAVRLADARGRSLASEIGAAKRAVEAGEADLERYKGLDEERTRLNELRVEYEAIEARNVVVTDAAVLVGRMRAEAARLRAAKVAEDAAREALAGLVDVPGLAERWGALRDAEGIVGRARDVVARHAEACDTLARTATDAEALGFVPALAERSRVVKEAISLTGVVRLAEDVVASAVAGAAKIEATQAELDALPGLASRLDEATPAAVLADAALAAAEREARTVAALSLARKLEARAGSALAAFVAEQDACPTCGAAKEHWRTL